MYLQISLLRTIDLSISRAAIVPSTCGIGAPDKHGDNKPDKTNTKELIKINS